MRQNKKVIKINKALKEKKIFPVSEIIKKDLNEGKYSARELNKRYKDEIEENNKLIRAKTAIKVKFARQELRLTQNQLAKKLHTSKSFISEIENGKQNISIEYASKIAKALNKEFVWEFK